jgi:hypothetical protein
MLDMPSIQGFGVIEPVPGEFVLMRQLMFGIARDNVSATDTI